MESTDHYQPREPSTAYNAHFGVEKGLQSTENTFYLEIKVEELNG